MTTFAANTAPPGGKDPAKHVNYTYGMLLGVDDFTQEFTYLSAKDHFLASTLGGYGTVRGLKVAYEPTYSGPARGPRLSVGAGAAISPSGKPVHVSPTQCAYLVEWLAAHRNDVVKALGGTPPGPPPPTGTLTLYLVLRYAACLTDKVPIPGEPCRTEDDLTAPSRVRDDFRLELSFAAPDQREEEAVQKFVAWLRKVPVSTTATTTLADFLAAMRTGSGIVNGVCPPLTGFFAAAPAAGIGIPSAQLTTYLRAAWRLWVTELLPCWRVGDSGCGCAGDTATPGTPVDTDVVLLAKATVAVLYDSVADRLLVGPAGVTLDESARPYLVNARFLQEWLLTPTSGSAGVAHIAAASAIVPELPAVVAGGSFDPEGVATFSHGGLQAVARDPSTGIFDLRFDDFDQDAHYIVTGTVIVAPDAPPHVVESVAGGPGLAVRVRRTSGRNTDIQGFQLQVTRFDGGRG